MRDVDKGAVEALYGGLCWYDRRNPNYCEEIEDPPAPRQEGCGCDPCFYGKDRLALMALAWRTRCEELERRVLKAESIKHLAFVPDDDDEATKSTWKEEAAVLRGRCARLAEALTYLMKKNEDEGNPLLLTCNNIAERALAAHEEAAKS